MKATDRAHERSLSIRNDRLIFRTSLITPGTMWNIVYCSKLPRRVQFLFPCLSSTSTNLGEEATKHLDVKNRIKQWFFVYLFYSNSYGKRFRKWNEQWIAISRSKMGGRKQGTPSRPRRGREGLPLLETPPFLTANMAIYANFILLTVWRNVAVKQVNIELFLIFGGHEFHK